MCHLQSNINQTFEEKFLPLSIPSNESWDERGLIILSADISSTSGISSSMTTPSIPLYDEMFSCIGNSVAVADGPVVLCYVESSLVALVCIFGE